MTSLSEVASPTAGGRAAVAPTRRNAILFIICAAVFLTALDQTVVVTALVPIASGYNIDPTSNLSNLSWVVSGYLLGYVIVMPLMGRVSDLVGRQRILLGCLGLFAFGSLVCVESLNLSNLIGLDFFHLSLGNSSALTWLIVARFLQAVGGGAVVPVAIAAIGDLYGADKRILALGIIGGVTEAGGALGPLYGALIVQKWSFLPNGFDQTWQWIFLLNLPLVALIVLGLVLLWPRELRQAAARLAGTKIRIDWLGALLLGGALFCTSLGLGQSAGAINTLGQAKVAQNNPLLLLAAAVLLVAFVLYELRQRDPVVQISIFRSGAFSAGAIFNLLLGMGLIVALVDIPIYILTAISSTAYLDAGLALLRMTVMIPIGAFSGGWLVTRFGTRPVGIAGALCTAAGFLIMHTWGVTPNWTLITVGTMIAGLGFGLIVAPISASALNTAPTERFGMAAAIVTSLRMIGMILGLAALSSWGVSRYLDLTSKITIPASIASDSNKIVSYIAQQTTQIGITIVTDFFLVGAVLALIAIIPALFLWKPKAGEEETKAKFVIGM